MYCKLCVEDAPLMKTQLQAGRHRRGSCALTGCSLPGYSPHRQREVDLVASLHLKVALARLRQQGHNKVGGA